jgi:hypothetical protein
MNAVRFRRAAVRVSVLTVIVLCPSASSARQSTTDLSPEDRWTIAAEVRIQYERFRNEEWGESPEDTSGYLLQRFIVGARGRINSRLATYFEIKSGLETGRAGGPRVPDEDQLDVHQAYADIGLGQSVLRVGRQELMYGSSRIISVRDLNVRQSFDAIRWLARGRRWRLDVFGATAAKTATGVFDDAVDSTRMLWGAYAVRAAKPSRGVDLYYLGYRNTRAKFDDAAGVEHRHSIGARLWGSHRAIDYNTELIGQWGGIGASTIRAWTIASETGYRLPAPSAHIVVRADVTSGDPERGDGRLGTFNALFPRGSYFGLIASAGPLNHVDIHPRLEWRAFEKALLTVEWLTYWRTETADGIYATSGRLLRSGLGTRSRLVGRSPGVTLQWDQSRQWSVLGHVSRFSAGPFIQESSGGHPALFVRLATTYRFASK